MNSRIIHQRETYIYFTIFALIGVFILNMFISILLVLAYPLLIGLIVQVILLQKMKKPFYRSGKELTEQLKLKNIFLVESNILGDEEGTVYEVHQMPFSFSNGLINKDKSYKVIKQEYDGKVKEDLTKIAKWQVTTKARLVTTTHFRLYIIWQKNSAGYQLKKFEDCIDPYAKMNLIQWVIASFCTTGRIKYEKQPKEWESYEWIALK
ncbi:MULTISPECIES: hypothetical protein [Bacillus cereus group]|uniref:hypothetical protein n=1 Tax=Bacillus cereus group TaxID=86661 RepID=UPI000BEBFA29|nr:MULTISPECIES: hypothetical protein [Bacillus cereus group]PDY15589.1 hypothetical protein COM76_28490 [Bacillus cereus]PET61627.1 hypothetical protein CN522_21155 [Bacillus cereus]PEU54084.1 hypothetical protein CN414_18465 [Bacillus cereus]PEX69595.1 hypothetical protein CN457_30860 [Bacillus cereus]PFA79957.1 hypothetical protein CN406_06410 [Bacillus cereus]